MLVLAREVRALTQSALARKAGTSQATLSKVEAGVSPASDELVGRIALVLDFPRSFFYQNTEVHGAGTSAHHFLYRKRLALGVTEQRRIQALVNVMRMHVETLLKAATVEVERQIPRLDPDDYDGDVERIAQELRATWLLPAGPIESVTQVIERAGGIVIPTDFANRQIDATSIRLPGLPPLFFVGVHLPGDRMRFTLAHELAHIVMHTKPDPEMEKQADRFASEFLMPATNIRSALSGFTLGKAAQLKPYWKVSMAALLVRAQKLGKISESQAERLWTQMGAAGYRAREPAELDVEREEPAVLGQLLELHRASLGYTDEELAQALHVTAVELQTLYAPPFKRAALRLIRPTPR
jgi:Zn-dependent peptidase ImmA (M78 family)